ncbi:MAG: M1 family metallopeptidase [Actinomycetota bacterium]
MTEGSRYRLPRTVVPERYELEVVPDLATRTFTGSVRVELTVREPVREIVLNAVALDLADAVVLDGGDDPVAVREIVLEPADERARIVLDGDLLPGPATLSLGFSGALNPKLAGFYPSTYRDADGVEHVVGTTQFESTDARRAFPCWDEPDLKAVFAVSLVVEEGHLAVSNAREIGREPAGPGRVRVRFADSMRMATYLVAYVVGDLEVTEPVDVDGTALRIVHVPGKGDLTRFGLEAGAAALRYFAGYYGIAYPGDKLDMVALPDFAQGAMENLGCITYREALLLVDPERASQSEQQRVAEVIAHEIAHMWFGDLVTMRWWNGIWLNEAFASLMETLAVDDWRPDWELWNQFARYRTVALEVDALDATRPIEYPVESPEDAQDMFDVLTYTKGEAVLRMLERFLGDDFRAGIRAYLSEHAYGNTETVDLWNALGAASGEEVADIMGPWIFRGGYPMLAASAEGDGVRITTSRFRLGDGEEDSPWQVPFFVRLGDRTERVLLPAGGTTLVNAGGGAAVVNAGGHAFVRVRYDEELLERLTRDFSSLPPIERYQLVDDTWAMVLAGDTRASTFLRLAEALGEETDVNVWQTVLVGLSWCERLLDGQDRERMQAFVRRLARPAFERLGLEPAAGESSPVRSLRGALLAGLGVLGNDPEVIGMAREEERLARTEGGVDPDVAVASVSVVAARGDVSDFATYLARATDAPTPQEQLRYLYELASFRDAEAFRRMLEHVDSPAVRVAEQPFLLRSAIANREHGPVAWAYVKERWDAIAARVPESNLDRLTDGVRFLITPELEADVATFFETHDVPGGRRQLRQQLERQRIGVRLRTRSRDDVAAFLASR